MNGLPICGLLHNTVQMSTGGPSSTINIPMVAHFAFKAVHLTFDFDVKLLRSIFQPKKKGDCSIKES